MAGPPAKLPTPSGAPVTPEIVAQLVAAQTRQFDIREKEIEVQRINAETERRKVENTHDYAEKALAAQAEDRKDERRHQAGNTRYGFWVVLIGMLVTGGLTAYAISQNQTQLIIEVVKAVVYAGAGGSIGYGIGHARGRKEKPEPQPPTG